MQYSTGIANLDLLIEAQIDVLHAASIRVWHGTGAGIFDDDDSVAQIDGRHGGGQYADSNFDVEQDQSIWLVVAKEPGEGLVVEDLMCLFVKTLLVFGMELQYRVQGQKIFTDAIASYRLQHR